MIKQNKPWITVKQIYTSYKNAKNKKDQLKILSDLSQMSQEELLSVIKKEDNRVKQELDNYNKTLKTALAQSFNARGSLDKDSTRYERQTIGIDNSKEKPSGTLIIKRKAGRNMNIMLNTDKENNEKKIEALTASKKESDVTSQSALNACLKFYDDAVKVATESENCADRLIKDAQQILLQADKEIATAETMRQEAEKARAAIKALDGLSAAHA